MDKPDEGRRYKWSNSATSMLVSIWSHDNMQSQLKMSTRNQPIWESIAAYMSRKGFAVTGLQCRTRIKNMLCTYHEAVRKKDPSLIEPYFDLFKKALQEKNVKKKETKMSKSIKQEMNSGTDDDEEDDVTRVSDMDQSLCQNPSDTGYHIEYLDANNQDAEPSSHLPATNAIVQLEKIITKAIETQTRTITQVIESQSRMIERLLTSERERLETIMASERESRRQLETRLDRLLVKLETTPVPQLTYMGTVIESRHEEAI